MGKQTLSPLTIAPVVSVVIPTRHRNTALAACLELLAPDVQTVAASVPYEVVVTDDGSQETAQALLEQRFPWVRWVPGPRKGPAANRNNGVRHANAPWIAFTDDDCLPDPHWIAAYFQACQNHPEYRVFEGKTSAVGEIVSPLDWAPVNETGNLLWSCNLFIHRDTFEKIGGFDTNFPQAHLEDVDLRERLRAADQNWLFVPSAIVGHPVRRVSLNESVGRQWECDVYYWYKRGKHYPAALPLFVYLLKCRIKRLFTLRSSVRDALIVLLMLLREIGYFMLHINGWEKKYRRLAPASLPRPSFYAAANHTGES